MLFKKMYFKLFNFMNGDNEKKFYRFHVHGCTVLMFLMPLVFLGTLITYLTGETVNLRSIASLTVFFLVGIVSFPCLVKLMMLWK